MRTYVIAFALSIAFSCLGQDVKLERVKVEPAKLTAFEVKDVDPVKETDPIKYKVKVEDEIAVAVAVAASYEAPSVLVALKNPTEAQAPYIVSATYAEPFSVTVKNCSPEKLIKTQTEWYNTFHAVQGSKIWWILRVAKKRAERGEDVSSLKKAFDETMKKWLLED